MQPIQRPEQQCGQRYSRNTLKYIVCPGLCIVFAIANLTMQNIVPVDFQSEDSLKDARLAQLAINIGLSTIAISSSVVAIWKIFFLAKIEMEVRHNQENRLDV
jgi:hypothetical protein